MKDLVTKNVNCDEFVSWKKGSVKSISLVYATGYLGNPASFYGHTLIKFNLGKPEKSFLLDSSINFGARVPPDENPVSYVVKGVTGGYDASFSHVDFYFHYNNYGELEKRDLWEYELALSQTEVDLIVGHIWEILDKRFTYYFLNKNCAYRMAEVLELADDFNLTKNLHSWVFPQSIFSNLYQHKINNENKIKNIKFHPSRQSRFFESFNELSAKEKEFFTSAAKNVSYINNSAFNALETHEKHKLLAALKNYFNLINKKDDRSVKIKEDIRKVHLKQLDLPSYIPNKLIQIKAPPHQSRKPSYIQISSISNKKLGQGSMIYLRPAYYDSLDTDNGHLPYSTLTMMGVKLAYQNNKLYLRSLDFVDVSSVSIAKTGLPGDEGKLWNIRAGIQQQNLSCIDCPIIRLQGSIGRSKKISDNTIFGFGIGAGIQNSVNQYGFGYVKSTIFANFSLHERNRFLFKAENRHHLASNVKDEFVYSLESRWKVSDNFDVRLGYNHDFSSEANISFGYYW